MARSKYWLPFLKDYLKVDENTLIIGHSSGATAAMRYAQNNKIWGSILVSPCYTDMELEEEKITGWYDEPWNWNLIKNNQNKIGLVYSKDDYIIPCREFDFVKNKLKPNEILEFENKGHFLRQDTFPELLELIKKMLDISNLKDKN